ncbi:MAG: protein kinase, partial [Sedimentisphaerales bacterium]|nr:protein kinase [Sedimentisphaerales bacterium]
MAKCLSPEQLSRYVAGECTADERSEIQAHLTVCEKCRQDAHSARGRGRIQAQSKGPASSESGGYSSSKGSPADRDESPTRSMPGIADSPTGEWTSGKGLSFAFENYEIIQELPQGGQAIVYKAIHKPTKTHVAIKILLPTLVASTRARYYFEREAELIASLDHPNIVKIRDSGIIHRQYFFVMEYIKGQPLDRYVEAQNLSFRQRIMLFDKICGAVTYAHQQGIVHRDLKSANVLIDERGEPHILDFGLAKAIGISELAQKDVMPTITGQWAGSLSNMSPEQAAAKPELIDVRTDVYALGMMLYHILTGQDPYDVTGSILQVLQNIQEAEPVRPSKIIRKFDPDVEAILLAALAKDRSQRYQSVASLQGDIENWLAGRPITVRSISTLYLMRKVIARHRYVAAVVCLLLLIIFSFSFISFNLFLTARAAQRDAEGISKQWSERATQLEEEQHEAFSIVGPLNLTNVLELLHEGNISEADKRSLVFANGSKERIAAVFLISPQPLKDKENEFRRRFGEEQAWFADFIVGEHHLKDGNK